MVASSDPPVDPTVDRDTTEAPTVEVEKPTDTTAKPQPETEATTIATKESVAPATDTAPESATNGPALSPSSKEVELLATPPNATATVATAAASAKTSDAGPPEQGTKNQIDTLANQDDGVNPIDFQGSVDTDNELPSVETLRKIENYIVLDRDGKTHTFKSLYSGKHVARRVLIVFVRHFFCGLCQDYLRVLSASITPEALLRLPVNTFIAVIGCGDPGLIDMYASATNCPFPIYADPTRKLYDELGMIKTLSMGNRPAYAQKSILKSSLASVVQGLRQIGTGLVTKAGDQRQIGGEFLFEPYDIQSPVTSPWSESSNKFESNGDNANGKHSDSLDGKDDNSDSEEKKITWCHRMKNTRDHAEVPEIMEVLGLDGQGQPIEDKKRWTRALEERKGTGRSMARQMSELSQVGA